MGTLTYFYTSLGTEGPGTSIPLGPFPQLTPQDVNIHIQWSNVLPHQYWITLQVYRSFDNAVAFSADFFPDSSGDHTDGGFWAGSLSGAAFQDWDSVRLVVHAFSPPLPALTQWTFQFTGPGINIVYCQYGTTGKDTTILTHVVNTFSLGDALQSLGISPMFAMLQPLVGWALDVGLLCGAGPPVLPAINNGLWWANIETLKDVVRAVYWPYLCKCQDGPTTPIAYPPPVITPPPGIPPAVTIPCANTDICSAIAQIVTMLQAMSRQIGMDLDVDQAMQRFKSPFAWIHGLEHPGLTGGGSFTVNRLIGIRIEVTGRDPGIVLPGTPPYYWDQGWCSVSDGGGMLQEVRITRDSHDWLPDQMQLASTVGYMAANGITLKITELRPES